VKLEDIVVNCCTASELVRILCSARSDDDAPESDLDASFPSSDILVRRSSRPLSAYSAIFLAEQSLSRNPLHHRLLQLAAEDGC